MKKSMQDTLEAAVAMHAQMASEAHVREAQLQMQLQLALVGAPQIASQTPPATMSTSAAPAKQQRVAPPHLRAAAGNAPLF